MIPIWMIKNERYTIFLKLSGGEGIHYIMLFYVPQLNCGNNNGRRRGKGGIGHEKYNLGTEYGDSIAATKQEKGGREV